MWRTHQLMAVLFGQSQERALLFDVITPSGQEYVLQRL